MNAVETAMKVTNLILEKLKNLFEWDVSPLQIFGNDGISKMDAFLTIM